MPAYLPPAPDRITYRTSDRPHTRACRWLAHYSVLVAILAGWCAAPARGGQTIDVHSDADLRRGAKIAEREDVNLLVHREIRVPKTIVFRGKDTIVRIIGASPDAGLFLDIVWDGDWQRTPKPAMNGLHFYSRQVLIHGLSFRGFEHHGALIKGHGRELLHISNCTFQDIGTIYYPSRVRRPKSLDDAIVTQCIAAHGMKEGHIEVIDSRFTNCCHNSHRWGRCIYSSALSITVLNNRFERCGNAFALNAYVPNGSATVLHNQVIDPMPSFDQPNDQIRPPFISTFEDGRNIAMLFNTFQGEFTNPFIGDVNPSTHWLDYNDYREVQLLNPNWCIGTPTGAHKIEAWQPRGLDRHSAMPTRPFKPYQKKEYLPDKPVKITPGPDLEPRQR